ncbi:uncharacterized protein LOC132562916 [Ylistrum balloti]|uniref:uncharacterized protein LOC132562916 n=1 Tax=Ylistrum balloti TaxID=509963 RepID=UPI002905AC2C|nr:uncharacterized protein LOC132562916 [Ylistrum balloti]
MECVKHPGNKIISVCVTCDSTLVCVDCMADEQHKSHVFEKPKTSANNIKIKLQKQEETVSVLMSCLEVDLDEAQKLKSQQEHNQNKIIKRINNSREEIIESVAKMADNFISQSETQFQRNYVKLQNVSDDISAKLENMRRHREEVKYLIDSKDDLCVIERSQKLKDIDVQTKPLPELETIEFIPGKINTSQLELMFGGISADMEKEPSLQGAQAPRIMSLSTKKESDFVGNLLRLNTKLVLELTLKHSKSISVSNICFGADGKVWIRRHRGREITLAHKHGKVEKTIFFDVVVRGMTVVNDNTLLICGEEDRDIKQFTLSNGEITSLFSTGKLMPRDICTAPNRDLYVTLRSSVDYKDSFNSESVLVRYSPCGREKDRAQYDRRGDALFLWPSRVRISNTGDSIGVINATEKDNNHLVLFNKDLTLRSRYLGHHNVMSREYKFDTTTYKPNDNYFINDFIFDSVGNIIICEGFTNCVQLLSRDCVPMQTLLPKLESIPMSIAMADDEMWLGCGDGTMNLYKVNIIYEYIYNIYLLSIKLL